MMPPDALQIVFICTANRARSPLAEAIAARHGETLPVSVTSRGTSAAPGAPAMPDAVWAGAELGVDLSAHRAQPIGAGELSGVDLAIGFEPFHVASAVVEGSAPRDRAFTIRELVALLPASAAPPEPLDHARAIVAEAHARRQGGALAQAGALDLADPYGRDRRFYRQTALEIDELVTRILSVMFRGVVRAAGGNG